ncbi:hypothetical protein SAY87_024642 [Trapa incisa]|uniref:Uncharacterized protein n=1 Tax=Trapa incisa TaxID=236973 RepID=A0AAN7JF92_9MYRT|nr:hypothetical protein SAY87_024642 [Trapa incisa]
MLHKVGCDHGEEGELRTAPKGHFVVYVGKDQQPKRFVLPLHCLKDPNLHRLLQDAAEEFDNFDRQRRIVLTCDVASFQRLVTSLALHP